MPDIFVPVDTTGITPYLRNVNARALPLRFAMNYVDAHRSELQKQDGIEGMRAYLESKSVLEEFIRYAQQEGVKENRAQIAESEQVLKGNIYGLIARGVWDNRGYYPFLQPLDNTLAQAIEALNTRRVLE